MGSNSKTTSTKSISEADLSAMEKRVKDFTKSALKTIPSLSKKELKELDKKVSASEEEIAILLKTMEQKMKVKIL